MLIIYLQRDKKDKGVWRMPRLSEAKKDVISCEKLGVSANNCSSQDIRMGQPVYLKNRHSDTCVRKLTRRTETSKYPEEEKTIVIPLVEAIEKGLAQTKVVSAILGL